MNEDHRLIETAHGRFSAESTLDASGPRVLVRTRVVGDRRDEVGDAIRTLYDLTRRRVREGGYTCRVNSGTQSPSLTWNGRVVECRLVTVEF